MKSQSQIGDVFNEMSGEYDSIMDQMVPHYRSLITAMFKYLPESFDPSQILDLGCGNGNTALVAADLFPSAGITLVDASEDMLTICRSRLGEAGYHFTHAMFQDLQLSADAFDLIYAGFSLHHLDHNEKESFFHEIFRALTPGGVFTCADLFINKSAADHDMHLKEWKSFCLVQGKSEADWDWLIEHYTAYDKPSDFADQRVWLEAAGFADISLSWNDGQWGCFHAVKT